MLVFRLDPFAPLLDTIPVLSHVGQKANIKSTASMLTLTVSPPSRHFIAALQMLPEFFNYFNSDETHDFRISLDSFYIIMRRMEIRGFSSMHFSHIQPLRKVILRFGGSSHEAKMLCELDLLPSEVEEIEQVDYGTFVSIDSQDFRRVVLELNSFSVYVSLTESQVKFSASSKDIVLTKEERRCIIGGLTEGEEFRFSITVHPWVFFHDLSHRVKRAWLFMSINFSSVIILPFGTCTQFWVYVPK